VWQFARVLTQQIYNVTRHGSFSKDYGLRDQIRRASVSIMANIAEGFERGGRKEFLQFLSMAKGSNGELKSHLYVDLDQNYIAQNEFDNLLQETEKIGGKIGGLINYLRKTDIRGSKYKL